MPTPALTAATGSVLASTVKAGKAGIALPATLGAIVAVGVVVATTFVAPKPAAASDLIDAAQARVITVNTWAEARGGGTTHVGPSATVSVKELIAEPGAATAALSDLTVAVPAGQRKYPAYFVANARVALSGGGSAYLFGHFSRASAGQPWKLDYLTYSTDKAKVPSPALDSNGHLKPLGKPSVDPASIPQRYADWGNRVSSSHQLGTDPVLDLSTIPTAVFNNVVSTVKQNNAHFSGTLQFTVSGVQPGVPLSDGTMLVLFTATEKMDLYNRASAPGGPCDQSDGYSYWVTTYRTPNSKNKEAHETVSGPATARIHPTGRATVESADYSLVTSNYVPC